MTRKRKAPAATPIDVIIPDGLIEAIEEDQRAMRDFLDGALAGVDPNDKDAVFGAVFDAAAKRLKP